MNSATIYNDCVSYYHAYYIFFSKTGEDDDQTIPPLDKIPTNEFIERFLGDEDDDRRSSTSSKHVALLTALSPSVKDMAKVTVEPLPEDNDDLETVLDDTGKS